jgi:hypothetical protein
MKPSSKKLLIFNRLLKSFGTSATGTGAVNISIMEETIKESDGESL